VNRCHLGGFFGLLVYAVVHYAEDELDNHCDYDDNAEDLMGRIEFFALVEI